MGDMLVRRGSRTHMDDGGRHVGPMIRGMATRLWVGVLVVGVRDMDGGR